MQHKVDFFLFAKWTRHFHGGRKKTLSQPCDEKRAIGLAFVVQISYLHELDMKVQEKI